MVKNLIDPDAILVTSNFSWIDGNYLTITVELDGVCASWSSKYVKNIVDIFVGKTNYFGCAMVFRKELIQTICPIPSFIESHDLWIPMAANIMKANTHIDEETFLKRKHNSNVTSTVSDRPLIKKLYSRLVFLVSGFIIFKRILFKSNWSSFIVLILGLTTRLL